MSDDSYSELDLGLLKIPENGINLKEKACVLSHCSGGFNYLSDCIIIKLKLDSVLINGDKLNECVNNLANGNATISC